MADSYFATSAPLEIMSFTSGDVDHARSLLNRFYYPLSVGVPREAGHFGLDLRMIQLGPLTVGQLTFDGPVSLVASELDSYHITLPTAGHVTANHVGREVQADPAQAVLFGPHGSVFTQHSPRSTELDLKIGRVALEAELAGLLGRPVTGPIDLPRQLAVDTGPGRSWRRLVLLLRDELTEPDGLLRKPLIAQQLQQSVLSGLLFASQHRYSEELRAPAPPGAPRALRRAVDAIHDEPERPFTVTDLAAIAGVSVRSLQEGFRHGLGCAPMAYLQHVRLDRVRAALLEAAPGQTTVAAVAHRWGFAHLGRFASVYRARFGTCPSDTLRAGG
jgi:AraC-like DNA-binding protein